MILHHGIVYRDIGLTAISPDYESTSRMMDVAKNFNIPVNLVDPLNSDSPGLNPFVFEDPTKIAIAISTILKGMYLNPPEDYEKEGNLSIASQAIENLSTLLKVMYPQINKGRLPNLEDMIKMLNNFELVEKMCKILETNAELAEKYQMQLDYFKKNFYQDGVGRADTQKLTYGTVSQFESLLRIEGVKKILCNRTNNINFDEALQNGDVILVCTRRGDLGATAHKAFGLFYLLLMQYSVLRRPGNESSRIPHFLYVDEFSPFINDTTTSIFTLYRKYRVGLIISVQNLDQLGNTKASKDHRQTILSNCATKMIFGNNSPEDNDWWALELGEKREWTFSNTYNTKSTDKEEAGYDPKYGNIKWSWVKRFAARKSTIFRI